MSYYIRYYCKILGLKNSTTTDSNHKFNQEKDYSGFTVYAYRILSWIPKIDVGYKYIGFTITSLLYVPIATIKLEKDSESLF